MLRAHRIPSHLKRIVQRLGQLLIPTDLCVVELEFLGLLVYYAHFRVTDDFASFIFI